MRIRWFGRLTFAVTLCAAGLARASVLIDFETATDLSNNFNESNSGAFTLTSTTPTIGTASLKNTADDTATYTPATFGLTVGQQISLSMKFSKTAATSTGAPPLQLGFGTASSDPFNTSATDRSAIFSRLLPTSSGNSGLFDFVYDNKVQPTATAVQATGQGGFVLDGTNNPFYLMTITLQHTATNSFVVTGKLQELNSDDTTVFAQIASYTSTTLNNSFMETAADNGSLSAAFRSSGQAFGALRLDDFGISDVTATPEPTSLALLASAGMLCLFRRPRAKAGDNASQLKRSR